MFWTHQSAACWRYCHEKPTPARSWLRRSFTQSSLAFGTLIRIGTCSSSHFMATVAFSGSRTGNSYVSHSWYSDFEGFTVTRSASSFGSYQ